MIHKKIILLVSLFVAFVVSGCSSGDTQNVAKNSSIPVEVYNVKQENVEVSFEYPTQLKSIQSVDIYARVQGTLLQQNFIEGTFVKEGDKLFKIDPARYEASVNIAKAQLLSAQATFKEAKRDWERSKKLFEEKALSPKERDQSLSAYESALANVENAKASLDNAMIDLEYTDVIATASGKIGMKNYDIGDLVGIAGGNNVLTTITQLDPIHAEFSIPNNDYYFLRNLNRDNIKVTYILPDGNDYKEKGKIDFIDNVVDSNTATIKARAIVANTDNLLVPGEFSRVKLDGFVAENAIAIPQNAVMQNAQGSFVYTIIDNKATITPVVLGNVVGNKFLVKSGLKDGDVVITSQLIKIKPGASVTPIGVNKFESK